jgi:hypothetical protein
MSAVRRLLEALTGDTKLDPQKAVVYFTHAYAEDAVEKDAQNRKSPSHDLAVALKGPEWVADSRKRDSDWREKHEAQLKAVGEIFSKRSEEFKKLLPGFGIEHVAGFAHLNTLYSFRVTSIEDVQKVWSVVSRNATSDGEIELKAPYQSLREFRFYPKGIHGPQIAMNKSGDIEAWLKVNKS